MAIKEAMAAALPVIGGAGGGVPEAVVDGETGFLVAGRRWRCRRRGDSSSTESCRVATSRRCGRYSGAPAVDRAEQLFSYETTNQRHGGRCSCPPCRLARRSRRGSTFLAKRFISLYYGSMASVAPLQALGRMGSKLVHAGREQPRGAGELPCARSSATGAGLRARKRQISAWQHACKSAGLGAGDEVLLSSYTCLAVPTAVIAAGAKPVYSDIDAETLNVDANVLSTAFLTAGTRDRRSAHARENGLRSRRSWAKRAKEAYL
jgi:hypothetical protein